MLNQISNVSGFAIQASPRRCRLQKAILTFKKRCYAAGMLLLPLRVACIRRLHSSASTLAPNYQNDQMTAARLQFVSSCHLPLLRVVFHDYKCSATQKHKVQRRLRLPTVLTWLPSISAAMAAAFFSFSRQSALSLPYNISHILWTC